MKITLFTKPFIWLVIICYGIYLPADFIPQRQFMNIPNFDKIIHFILFFVLCLLMFKPLKRLKTKHYILAPGISLSLAAIIEFTQQWFSSTRQSNLNDFLANVAGIVTSMVIYIFLISEKKTEKYL